MLELRQGEIKTGFAIIQRELMKNLKFSPGVEKRTINRNHKRHSHVLIAIKDGFMNIKTTIDNDQKIYLFVIKQHYANEVLFEFSGNQLVNLPTFHPRDIKSIRVYKTHLSFVIGNSEFDVIGK